MAVAKDLLHEDQFRLLRESGNQKHYEDDTYGFHWVSVIIMIIAKHIKIHHKSNI